MDGGSGVGGDGRYGGWGYGEGDWVVCVGGGGVWFDLGGGDMLGGGEGRGCVGGGSFVGEGGVDGSVGYGGV